MHGPGNMGRLNKITHRRAKGTRSNPGHSPDSKTLSPGISSGQGAGSPQTWPPFESRGWTQPLQLLLQLHHGAQLMLGYFSMSSMSGHTSRATSAAASRSSRGGMAGPTLGF